MADVQYRNAAPADLPALCALINAGNRADGIPEVATEEELAEDINDFGDITTDVRLAHVGDELVGFVRTLYIPSDELWERCYLFGVVLPAHRRKGIGRKLMAWAIDRGTAQLRSSNNQLPKYLRVDAENGDHARYHFFERLGFREVRQFQELMRPIADLPPLSDAAGVRIVPWPADRDEEIRVVKNKAFADHWGSTPMPPHHWNTMVRGFGSLVEHSFIALDADDRVVGYCLNHRYSADDDITGRRVAWIDNLGTLPEWRGRGVATALITRSLHAFADIDMTHVSLGVDKDSLTGATRLYKSLGFEPHRGHATLEIAVDR